MRQIQNPAELLPLTKAQRALWMKQQIETDEFSLIIAESLKFEGDFQPDSFIESLKLMTEELEVTRVQFVVQDGTPKQFIHESYPGEFKIHDFSAKEEPEESARQWMKQQVVKPICLEKDPLWLNALLKLNEKSWIWIQWGHHMLFDGYSGGLIARRLSDIYSALITGEPLPECNCRPFKEHIESEQQYLNSRQFQRDEQYWKSVLDGISDAATLSQRPGQESGKTLYHTRWLESKKVKKLAEFAGGESCSLPQVLIALAGAYYARATDSAELMMATMLSGRITKAARVQQGMLAKVAPLKLHMDKQISFRQYLKEVSAQLTRALRYQRYSFDDMRKLANFNDRESQIARLGINIETFYHSFPFGNCQVSAENMSNGSIDDFTIFVYHRQEDSDALFSFEANDALYSEQEIQQHAERFMFLLDSILDQPDSPLAEVPMVSLAERHKLLVEWNDTKQALTTQTITGFISQQALERPDSSALCFNDIRLSYGELEAATNAYAQALIRKGIKPGHLVAIAIPRSELTLISMLAVLKAGAAYLPLDLNDPPSRLSAILEDAKPEATLVTHLSAVDVPINISGLINVDLLDTKDDSPVDLSIQSSRAYVIFTSGSTGRPKGVEVHHRGLVNLLCSAQDLTALTEEDRLLAVTTVAFDIAALELFMPLVCGACVVIAPREIVKDPLMLATLVQQEKVSCLQATPSLWRTLAEHQLDAFIGVLPLVGGEALTADLAQKLAKFGRPVLNMYGPTETTIWSTAMKLSDEELIQPAIGRPLWNTSVYVLDRNQQLVPIGASGELYIAGAGVAHGYLQRPELTASRFVDDPFVNDGTKMYRTGDLVRWRNDGVLEYLGRNDHQIKVRGYRVELGEIEAAFLAQPNVHNAVVVLRECGQAGEKLFAYVAPQNHQTLDSVELLKAVAKQVPAHMVPLDCIVLDSLPLNTNGKIDRNALPQPDTMQSMAQVAPRTQNEQMLADIWCETLGFESVGVHDNLFDLGADSIMAANMVAKLHSKFGLDISLAKVFRNPTIAKLASQLDSEDNSIPLLANVIPIRALGTQSPLFCIHPLSGLGWGFHSLAGSIDLNRPIYALQSDALGQGIPLADSIEEMASGYVKRIYKIQPEGPYNLIGWSFGGLVAHEMAYQLEAEGHQVNFLGLMDSYIFRQSVGSVSESELAKATLEFLGYELEQFEMNPDVTQVHSHIAETFQMENADLLEQFIAQDSSFVERVRSSMLAKLDMAQVHVPKVVSCDIDFFHAAHQTQTDTLNTVMYFDADCWHQHTHKACSVTTINCDHLEMMNVIPAKKIGAIANRRMQENQKCVNSVRTGSV